MVVKCEKCGKEFKDNRGLKGHMAGVHGLAGRADYKVVLQELANLKETLEKFYRGLKHLDAELHSLKGFSR
jgi:hypothetical protein